MQSPAVERYNILPYFFVRVLDDLIVHICSTHTQMSEDLNRLLCLGLRVILLCCS